MDPTIRPATGSCARREDVMRTMTCSMVAALLLSAASAAAQAPASPENPFINQVDFGVRATAYAPDSDQARFQRYRDIRDGVTLDKFRALKDTDAYVVNLQADHVGYRDQRFYGSAERYNKLKASFEWNQVPLYYSNTVETLYDSSTFGRLTMRESN